MKKNDSLFELMAQIVNPIPNLQRKHSELQDYDFMRITAEKKVKPREYINLKDKEKNIEFNELKRYESYEKVKPSDVIIFGDWVVDIEGNLDCPKACYFIEKDRLTEDDWISHLMGKVWLDFNTFLPAYWEALMINKIKDLTINIR